MSDSSKSIEFNHHHSSEIDNEPLDPRIQIELERANAATIEINNLETQLDDAQKLFQSTFNACKQRLAILARTLGRCVEHARPYYDACKLAEEARLETRRVAQEYQDSMELYHAAKENLALAEKNPSRFDDKTFHEYVDHVTLKITQTEQDKNYYERSHEEKSKLYQHYEQHRMALHRSRKKAIAKSKSYFDAKSKAESDLKNQKRLIEDVQKAITQAKANYRTALNNLEQISDEIHAKRKEQILSALSQREPAIGAESTDHFIELPTIEFSNIDLFDDLSDNDLPKSINSVSVNASPKHLSSSSNIDISAINHSSSSITNKLSNHFSIQTIGCLDNENNQRMQKHLVKRNDQLKVAHLLTSNETPLLSLLCGTNKCHSDSNLDKIIKQ